MRLAGLPFALVALACGGAGAPPEAPPDGRRSGRFADAIAAWEVRGNEAPRVVRGAAAAEGAPPSRARPSPGVGARPAGRPARRRIDVDFRHADLVNALRFLAEAAGVSLVIDEGVHGEVDGAFRRVDAYDTLVTLAESHGARVTRQGSIVQVRPPD